MTRLCSGEADLCFDGEGVFVGVSVTDGEEEEEGWSVDEGDNARDARSEEGSGLEGFFLRRFGFCHGAQYLWWGDKEL